MLLAVQVKPEVPVAALAPDGDDEENNQREWFDNFLSQNAGILSPVIDEARNVLQNSNGAQVITVTRKYECFQGSHDFIPFFFNVRHKDFKDDNGRTKL